MTNTRPRVTFRFSMTTYAIIGLAGSYGCAPPRISTDPPGTPESKTYTGVSIIVPAMPAKYVLSGTCFVRPSAATTVSW